MITTTSSSSRYNPMYIYCQSTPSSTRNQKSPTKRPPRTHPGPRHPAVADPGCAAGGEGGAGGAHPQQPRAHPRQLPGGPRLGARARRHALPPAAVGCWPVGSWIELIGWWCCCPCVGFSYGGTNLLPKTPHGTTTWNDQRAPRRREPRRGLHDLLHRLPRPGAARAAGGGGDGRAGAAGGGRVRAYLLFPFVSLTSPTRAGTTDPPRTIHARHTTRTPQRLLHRPRAGSPGPCRHPRPPADLQRARRRGDHPRRITRPPRADPGRHHPHPRGRGPPGKVARAASDGPPPAPARGGGVPAQAVVGAGGPGAGGGGPGGLPRVDERLGLGAGGCGGHKVGGWPFGLVGFGWGFCVCVANK